MRSVRFELLRPGEIIRERARFPVVYLPLGPLEWHSLHLPMGTDPLNAEAVARQVAETTGGVVLPTFFWGTERARPPDKLRNLGFDADAYIVGMDFPDNQLPSLYAREETFGVLIREILDQLVSLNYRLIVIVNGHGGKNHLEVLKRLVQEYNSKPATKVLLSFALPRSSFGAVGHADAIETSVMMALHPDCVDLSQLPDKSSQIFLNSGIVDAASFAGQPTANFSLPTESDPRYHASENLGRELFDQTISEVIKAVEETLHEMEGSSL
jgi:creatinine amidohydrolase